MSRISKELCEMFAEKFRPAFDNWKKSSPKGEKWTQITFARRVATHFYDRTNTFCGISANLISRYYRGEAYPETYLEDIIAVLGVPEDYFSLKSRDELYKGDKQFLAQIGKDLLHFANEIGLSIDFLKALLMITPFANDFPFYSPMVINTVVKDFDFTKEVQRMDLAKAGKMNAPENILQISSNGKSIILSKADLMFLKEVQTNVSAYIERLFDIRHKEMRLEEEKLDALIHPPEANGLIIERGVSYEDMVHIDRFYSTHVKVEEDK